MTPEAPLLTSQVVVRVCLFLVAAIYQRLTTEHQYAGSYASLYRFVRSLEGTRPEGFIRMEVKPGGYWRFVQHNAQGEEFAFHGAFHSIEAPSRLVQTFEWEGMPGHVSLDTLTLEEKDGKTLLTSHSVFQSVADRDGMMATGMEEGGYETMDRLAELVEMALTSLAEFDATADPLREIARYIVARKS